MTVTAGATLLVYTLVQGPEIGWTSSSIIISAVLSILLLALFIWIELRSKDPLMPIHLLRNRNLISGMTTTFIFMGTFGALPYFLTVLFQSVQLFSALQTGLAFLVPAISIAIGTQLGAKLVTHFQTRSTLIIGFIIGIIGTLLLTIGGHQDSSYWSILPGLIISGIGQGITWTSMWIVASMGVADKEQGVASAMASTALNIGNAVRMAILIAVANIGTEGKTGATLISTLASGGRTVFYLAAVGMLVGLIVAVTLPRSKTKKIKQELAS
ncbi:MFS transporter [Paenibacillus sp. FSL H7-0326]